MTRSSGNHDNNKIGSPDRPAITVARLDFLDLYLPIEVVVRGKQPVGITPIPPPVPVSTPRPRSPLKPNQPASHFYTPRALAKYWGVHVDKVLRFIHTGELSAFNAASRQSKRPRYRISLDAGREFEAAHAACPAGPPKAAPARRQKRTDTAGVHRYF